MGTTHRVKSGDVAIMVGTRKGGFILWSTPEERVPSRDARGYGHRHSRFVRHLHRTNSGQIFYSRDDGESWELMIEYLPPINSIEVAMAK